MFPPPILTVLNRDDSTPYYNHYGIRRNIPRVKCSGCQGFGFGIFPDWGLDPEKFETLNSKRFRV